MNKKNKGFTLIELLAVIVILAVIALIVTPIVTGIIGESKASADRRSAEGYVKAAENYFAGSEINDDKKNNINKNIINKIELSGASDAQGYLSTNESGQVTMAIVLNNKCYVKKVDQGIAEMEVTDDTISDCANKVGKNEEISATSTVDTYLKAVQEAAITYKNNHGGTVPTYDAIKSSVSVPIGSLVISNVTFDSSTGNIVGASVTNSDYSCSYMNNATTCDKGPEIPKRKIQFTLSIPTIEGSRTLEVDEGTTWNQCIASGPCNGVVMIAADSYLVYGPKSASINPEHPHYGDSNKTPQQGTMVIKENETYEYNNTSLCFVAGTKVLTRDGLVNIEDVKVGDYVYSYNEESNTYSYQMVTLTHKNVVTKDKTTITINGEEIISTSNHPYFTVNRGWVSAQDLKKEDLLLTSDNTISQLSSVVTIKSNTEYTVYNLSIENNHTYFVGDNRVLVHNIPESLEGC